MCNTQTQVDTNNESPAKFAEATHSGRSLGLGPPGGYVNRALARDRQTAAPKPTRRDSVAVSSSI